MRLALRPAAVDQLEFCESLTRGNLSVYLSAHLAATGTPWDPGRHLAGWGEFENPMIRADDRVVGLPRLRAIPQASSLAAKRGFGQVRLQMSFRLTPGGEPGKART